MVYLWTGLSLCATVFAYLIQKKSVGIALCAYAISLVLLLVPAGVGMDFSPSFTAWFLFACLCLCICGELGGRVYKYFFKKDRIYVNYTLGALFILGNLFVLPATYIYAVGDDWLHFIVWATIVLSILAAVLLFIFTEKEEALIHRILISIQTWVSLMAGIFTVFCGIFSTALLPVGLGVLTLGVVQRCKKDWLRGLLFWVGIVLITVWLVAPMVV